MSRYIPENIKYKGFFITQKDGEILVKDKNRHIILRVLTRKPYTASEIYEMFEFNSKVFNFDKGGG